MANDPTNRQTIAISFKEFRDEEIVEFFANENRSFQPGHESGNSVSRSRIVGSPHFRSDRKPTAAFRSSVRIDEPFVTDRFSEQEESVLVRLGDATEEESMIRVGRGVESKNKRKKTIEPAFNKSTKPLGSLALFGRNASLRKELRAARIVNDPLEEAWALKQERKAKESNIELHPFRPEPVESASQQTVSMEPVQEPEFLDLSDSSLLPEEPVDASETTIGETIEYSQTDDPRPEILPIPETEAGSVENSVLETLRHADVHLRQLVESWPKLPSRIRETISALIEISDREESADSPKEPEPA